MAQNQNAEESSINWEFLKNSEFGHEGEPVQEILTNTTAFKSMWNQEHSRVSPIPDIPQIDFENKEIIYLHGPQYSHGGTKFKIDSIAFSQGKYIVYKTPPQKDDDLMTTMVMTNPFAFILVDKRNAEEVILK